MHWIVRRVGLTRTGACTNISKATVNPYYGREIPRGAVLLDMAYNMGVAGLMNFHHMLAAVQAGDWKTAAAEMLNSTWAKQVKNRAYRLAAVMENGHES